MTDFTGHEPVAVARYYCKKCNREIVNGKHVKTFRDEDEESKERNRIAAKKRGEEAEAYTGPETQCEANVWSPGGIIGWNHQCEKKATKVVEGGFSVGKIRVCGIHAKVFQPNKYLGRH